MLYKVGDIIKAIVVDKSIKTVEYSIIEEIYPDLKYKYLARMLHTKEALSGYDIGDYIRTNYTSKKWEFSVVNEEDLTELLIEML